MNQWRINNKSRVIAGCLAGVVCLGVSAIADEAERRITPRNAWVPPAVDREVYRDIADYNIFKADRLTIARQVDRERQPPAVEENEPPVTRAIDTPPPPPDPDTFWRLTGITQTPKAVVAYLEHTASGELVRLDQPAAFSKGEIKSIQPDAIVYMVGQERRLIQIGQSLLAERVIPAGTTRSSNTESKNTSNLSAADRLRLLKEQRAREQGTAPAVERADPETNNP